MQPASKREPENRQGPAFAKVQMAKVRGLSFNVRVSGNKPPFIWGHTLMGSIASDEVLDFLDFDCLAKQARLIRYDARGHGLSEGTYRSFNYQWLQLADDMLALADQQGAQSFIAGGQSMGSATSLYAAMIAPKRVKGLVLMNPPTAWETREKQSKLYQFLSEFIRYAGPRALAKVAALRPDKVMPMWIPRHKQRSKAVLGSIGAMNRKSLTKILRGAAASDMPTREELSSIQAPALILAWADDPTHPISTARDMAASLPNATLVIAKNAREIDEWPEITAAFLAGLK